MDGTLFNSTKQIISSANLARQKLGYVTKNKDFYEPFIGLSAGNLFSDLSLKNRDIEIIVSEFRKHLSESIKTKNILFGGVLKFLKKTKESNILIGIATTKPTAIAKLVIRNSEIRTLINHIQGTDSFAPKPNPTVILKCLDKFKTSNAIMFGDRIEDITAGKNAGIISVGISQGFHSSHALSENGASLVFDNFTTALRNWRELMNILGQEK